MRELKAIGIALALVGCQGQVTVSGGAGGHNTTSSDAASTTAGTTSGTSGGGMGGAGAGDVGSITSAGTGGFVNPCPDLYFEPEFEHDPADIIFAIDNSVSMDAELNAIEQNINPHLAQQLTSLGVDYRVVMLTSHGNTLYDVCVPPPLSGTSNCAGPPINVPDQFYHYSVNIQSHNAMCKILNTVYGNEADAFNLAPGGYSQWLRPEALKALVIVSDDGSSCTWNGNNYNDGNNIQTGQDAAIEFDKDLLALSPLHFGTQDTRRYALYSLIALAVKNPANPTEPWGPFDPVTTNECFPGAVDPGTAYQWLSKGTYAPRFPLCDTTSYPSYFQTIAADLEQKTRLLCEMHLPEPPMGEALDLNALSVIYTPSDSNIPQEFTQVMGAAQCSMGSFYIDTVDDLIKLCPQTCTTVKDDPDPDLEIKLICPGKI